MKKVEMQEKRRDQPPELALLDYGKKVERAETMENDRIGQRPSPELDARHRAIQDNQNDHYRRAAYPLSILRRGFAWNVSGCAVSHFQCAEDSNLIAQLRRGMQELQRGRESSGRFVAALGGELRRFPQPNRRQK